MDASIPISEKTVRVGPLVNIPRLLRSLGHDPQAIFEACGLDPALYTDSDSRVPFVPSSVLLTRCVEVTGCEHFGLLLGQMAKPSLLGMPGFLVHAAPTVEKALNAVVEFLDLHDEGGTAMLNTGPEFSSFSYTVHIEGVEALDQINDLAAVMICKIMGLLCGPEWCAKSVGLARRAPKDRKPYRNFFHAPMYFDSSECEVTFSNRCLENEPPTGDELLFRHLEQEARTMHDLQHGELADMLPAVMRQCLINGKFSANDVAEAFGIHERTLHRRLKGAGTSFRHELDTVRRTVSEQLLGNTTLAVGEIATTMGYADASGFIRAFERWLGVSPNTWRKKHSRL